MCVPLEEEINASFSHEIRRKLIAAPPTPLIYRAINVSSGRVGKRFGGIGRKKRETLKGGGGVGRKKGEMVDLEHEKKGQVNPLCVSWGFTKGMKEREEFVVVLSVSKIRKTLNRFYAEVALL